jgi:replication factor A1
MSNVAFKKEEFKSTAEVISEELGSSGEKPDYFSLRATIVYIKSTGLSYPACPGEKCAKKMSQEGDDVWRCEKCEKTYSAPEHR